MVAVNCAGMEDDSDSVDWLSLFGVSPRKSPVQTYALPRAPPQVSSYHAQVSILPVTLHLSRHRLNLDWC